jgi:hypothetical protein
MVRKGNSDLVDIEVQIHHDTGSAVRVSLDGNDKKSVWLPLSLIEVEHGKRGIATVTLPEWLAQREGLI